jgi:hypothetical protein
MRISFERSAYFDGLKCSKESCCNLWDLNTPSKVGCNNQRAGLKLSAGRIPGCEFCPGFRALNPFDARVDG